MTIAHFHDRGSFRLVSGLPAPRQHEGTGAWIYPAILAQPGVHAYTTPVRGRVYTPASTLSDKSYVDSLVGTPLLDQPLAHDGVTTETIAEHRIGHIYSARWDEDLQSVVGEILVDVDRGLQQVDAGKTGLSLAYDGDPEPQTGEFNGQPFDFVVTRRYNANNILLTASPRHQGAGLFTDSEDPSMDPKKLLDALDKRFPGFSTRFADEGGEGGLLGLLLQMLMTEHDGRLAGESMLADMKAQMADMVPRPPAGDAEAAEADVEEAAEGEDMTDAPVKRMSDSLDLAKSLGIEVQDAWKLSDLQKAIVKKQKHRMADSLSGDALAAAVEGIRVSRPAADAWNDGWERKPLNRDTNPTPSADPLDAV